MASVTVTGIHATALEVVGARDFRISEGGTRVHHSVLLRLVTSEPGLEGHAEIVSAPPGKPEEFVEEIVGAVRRFVAPALIGLALHERAFGNDRVAHLLKGRIWTKAAVDVALHDLWARWRGLPVHELLGGRRRQDVGVLGPVLSLDHHDAMAAAAAAQIAVGHATVKIKVGETVASDIARVQAVREAIGTAPALRIDVNDHYEPAEAIRFIRAIERYGPEHVEQPVRARDLAGIVAVQAAVGVPVMTDDAIATPQDALNLLRLGGVERVKVKVTKHGFSGARAILGMMEAAGVRCVLGHVFQMGLAAAAEAHLAVTAKDLAMPCEIGSLRPISATADIVADDLFPEPGRLRVPDGPGLGVRLDRAAVEKLSVRFPAG